MSAKCQKRTSALFTLIPTAGSRDDLATSLYPCLRSASASPETGDRTPDPNLKTGIASWGRCKQPDSLNQRGPVLGGQVTQEPCRPSTPDDAIPF